MDPMQQQMQSFNNPNTYLSTQLDTTFNISSSASDIQDNTVVRSSSSSNNSQETVCLTKYSFFYNPPNDLYIYNIVCKEIPISFELVFQLLNNDNNNSTQHDYAHSNNLHEFHFLKSEEKKCY